MRARDHAKSLPKFREMRSGALRTNDIHIATCDAGQVSATLAALRASPATARAKARFILATDGATLEAEDLTSDDPPVACACMDFRRL